MESGFKKKSNMIFMHNNVPSHLTKKTNKYLNKIALTCSPGHNPIENLWNIQKRKVYIGRWKFTIKDYLCNAILNFFQSVSYEETTHKFS